MPPEWRYGAVAAFDGRPDKTCLDGPWQVRSSAVSCPVSYMLAVGGKPANALTTIFLFNNKVPSHGERDFEVFPLPP